MLNRAIRDIIRDQHLHTVPTTASVRTAAHMMRDCNVGALLVLDGGRLAGIFTERDALFRVLAGGLDPDRTKVSQIMTAEPMTIEPDRSVMHALHLMHDGGFRHLPVVDRGRPVGMLSIRDAVGPELVRLEREIDHKVALSEILA